MLIYTLWNQIERNEQTKATSFPGLLISHCKGKKMRDPRKEVEVKGTSNFFLYLYFCTWLAQMYMYCMSMYKW